MKENRDAIVGAALVLISFGIAAFLLPRVVLAVGEFSTWTAAAVAALFVAAFFAIFWLRALWQRSKDK